MGGRAEVRDPETMLMEDFLSCLILQEPSVGEAQTCFIKWDKVTHPRDLGICSRVRAENKTEFQTAANGGFQSQAVTCRQEDPGEKMQKMQKRCPSC